MAFYAHPAQDRVSFEGVALQGGPFSFGLSPSRGSAQGLFPRPVRFTVYL